MLVEIQIKSLSSSENNRGNSVVLIRLGCFVLLSKTYKFLLWSEGKIKFTKTIFS